MDIIGRLTRDAEVRTTSQDKQVVNFTVAINDGYRNKKGERIERATFFDCAYWNGTGIAQWLTKGTLVELSGMVSARAWIGKDGEPRAGLKFHTSKIKMHGGYRGTSSGRTATEAKAKKVTPLPFEGDLPF